MPSRPRSRHAGARLMTTRPVWEPSAVAATCTPRVAGAAATLGASGARALEREVDTELLQEREREVIDLRETIEILELKIAKLEQLVRLKDAKIAKLQNEAS